MRNILLGCLLMSIVLLTTVYDSSGKQSKPQDTGLKIGVIQIREVFRESNRNIEHQKELTTEEEKVVAELEKLSKEVQTLKADLLTRKPGSSDYSKLMQQMMEKQASMEAKKEFHQQEMSLKDLQWTEQLYKDIIKTVKDVAKANNLDIVLAKEETAFPTSSQTELMLAIRTNKLLYSTDSLDITKEVIKALNEKK